MGGTWSLNYKKWLESLNEPAPEGAWNSISNVLDIDDTWVEISNELDINDVWRNIEVQLPAQNISPTPASHKHSTSSYWIAATLILLTIFLTNNEPLKVYSVVDVGIADISASDRDRRVDGQNDACTDTSNPTQDADESIPLVTDRLLKQEYTAANRLPTPERTSAIQVGKTFEHDEKIFLNHTLAKQSTLPSWPFSDLPTDANIPSYITNNDRVSDLSDSSIRGTLTSEVAQVNNCDNDAASKETLRPARWRFGIIGSVSNTWLLNKETTNGLKRSALNSTVATFGQEFGLSLDNRIGNRSFLRAEYYFNNENGQRYREYLNALYQEKTIRLQYQKLQLAYSWSVMRRPSLFQSYVFGGVYASKLKVADLTIGSDNGRVTKEYKPWDFGVLFGIETEFNLNHRLVVVPGLRANHGLQNVFDGSIQAPSYFNKTKTAAIGFSVAIKYQY